MVDAATSVKSINFRVSANLQKEKERNLLKEIDFFENYYKIESEKFDRLEKEVPSMSGTKIDYMLLMYGHSQATFKLIYREAIDKAYKNYLRLESYRLELRWRYYLGAPPFGEDKSKKDA